MDDQEFKELESQNNLFKVLDRDIDLLLTKVTRLNDIWAGEVDDGKMLADDQCKVLDHKIAQLQKVLIGMSDTVDQFKEMAQENAEEKAGV